MQISCKEIYNLCMNRASLDRVSCIAQPVFYGLKINSFWFVTYLSYLLFKLQIFNLVRFFLCFHIIIVFIVSCVLCDDKNGTKSRYILLRYYHFTCFKRKTQ